VIPRDRTTEAFSKKGCSPHTIAANPANPKRIEVRLCLLLLSNRLVRKLNNRHSGESRNPAELSSHRFFWIPAFAGMTKNQTCHLDSAPTSAMRSPMMARLLVGSIPLRDADRQCMSREFQHPPRCTRNEPVEGPVGSVTAPLG
jgi:hypothetical protein